MSLNSNSPEENGEMYHRLLRDFRLEISQKTTIVRAIPIGRILVENDLTMWVVAMHLGGHLFALRANRMEEEERFSNGIDCEFGYEDELLPLKDIGLDLKMPEKMTHLSAALYLGDLSILSFWGGEGGEEKSHEELHTNNPTYLLLERVVGWRSSVVID